LEAEPDRPELDAVADGERDLAGHHLVVHPRPVRRVQITAEYSGESLHVWARS
jgi:hypothetical protein